MVLKKPSARDILRRHVGRKTVLRKGESARELPLLPPNLYTYRDEPAIRRFIAKYPFLLPLLEEIPPHIRAYFPDEELELSVETDPENGRQTLYIGIVTRAAFEQVWQQIRAFEQDWWIDNVHRGDYKLIIGNEYL